MNVRAALQTLLDQVDYTAGACRVNEAVGAVLPIEVIQLCREALANDPHRDVRTRDEIQMELDRIKLDERLSYAPANVFVNAPLALIQVELAARVSALAWVLLGGVDVKLVSSAAEGSPDETE